MKLILKTLYKGEPFECELTPFEARAYLRNKAQEITVQEKVSPEERREADKLLRYSSEFSFHHPDRYRFPGYIIERFHRKGLKGILDKQNKRELYKLSEQDPIKRNRETIFDTNGKIYSEKKDAPLPIKLLDYEIEIRR